MALQKTFPLPTGVDATYHKIARLLDYTRDAQVELWIEGYKDQAAREAGKQPLTIERVKCTNGMIKDTSTHIIITPDNANPTAETADAFDSYMEITNLNPLDTNPWKQGYLFLKQTDKYYDASDV